tara:strand:+ start:1639 stop:3009 length:1371 start_codon:yes stop_codon:yes gene_type:complete
MNNIYQLLPEYLQNIFVTLKNVQVYYNKYGVIPFFNSISKVQKNILANEKVMVNYNVKMIANFVQYCVANVPYFIKKKNIYNISIKQISDFEKLPIVSKAELKKNIEQFYSKKIAIINYTKFQTSGTTGNPMIGFIRKRDLQKRFRIILKTMCESGFDLNSPYARFLGKDIAKKGKVYRKDILHNHYFFSIFRISQENILKYYNALIEHKIKFIEGYPSTINNLVNMFRRNNLVIENIKVVMVTAEKLNIYQRENIEDYFGCKVFDYYGSTEQSVYIYKPTTSNTYFVSNLTGYIEVIKEDGTLARKGEEGQILITSFTSHFTPLVRYEIGDRCVVKDILKLEDGSLQYEISEIIGRNEESFATKDGRIVSRFSLVLKFLPYMVKAAQLFLSERNNVILVKYIAEKQIPASDFDSFVKKMNYFVGLGYFYKFTKVEELESTKSGKVRTVFIEKNEK